MSQWDSISKRWDEWTPPLRPSIPDIASFYGALSIDGLRLHPNHRNLLLGSTPELKMLAFASVDGNETSLRAHDAKRPCLGHWERLPFRDATFDAVIGDGSLNVFEGDPAVFFAEARRVLKPDGKLVLRVFTRPEVRESVSEVLAKKDDGGSLNFHAFKWRVAQALADPHVPVRKILRFVRPVWDHPTLKIYEGAPDVYYFPTLSELPKWSSCRTKEKGAYPLAERCPIITWTF